MDYSFGVQFGPDSLAGDIGSLVPGGVFVFGGCSGVVEYPPGFVFDPHLAPIDQWPYDRMRVPAARW
jgi:hypothetical protein